MSALEPCVRVNSEKQTLILAGEVVPRRPLTIVATPIDEPLLIDLAPSYGFADRGIASNAATAYARTQQLTAGNSRTAIIDTYA